MSVYCNCCGKEHREDDARLCGKCSSDTPLADEVRKLTSVHWDGDYRQDEIRELADRIAAKERDLAEARECLRGACEYRLRMEGSISAAHDQILIRWQTVSKESELVAEAVAIHNEAFRLGAKAERERCIKIVHDAREYCRNREYGKETMLDDLESYAIDHISQEAGR